jgi:hypothetical protein
VWSDTIIFHIDFDTFCILFSCQNLLKHWFMFCKWQHFVPGVVSQCCFQQSLKHITFHNCPWFVTKVVVWEGIKIPTLTGKFSISPSRWLNAVLKLLNKCYCLNVQILALFIGKPNRSTEYTVYHKYSCVYLCYSEFELLVVKDLLRVDEIYHKKVGSILMAVTSSC